MTKIIPKQKPTEAQLDEGEKDSEHWLITDDAFEKKPFELRIEHQDERGRIKYVTRGSNEDVKNFRFGAYGPCCWHPVINGIVTIVEMDVGQEEAGRVLSEVQSGLAEHDIKSNIEE